MSRTALDGFPLGDIEKDFMLDLISRYAILYLVEILGFYLMETFLGERPVPGVSPTSPMPPS